MKLEAMKHQGKRMNLISDQVGPELEQCTPSLSQANRMKRMSQTGNLDMDAMYDVLGEDKSNQRVQIKIQADGLDQ